MMFPTGFYTGEHVGGLSDHKCVIDVQKGYECDISQDTLFCVEKFAFLASCHNLD